VLRVRDDVIVLQTMLWTDEVRTLDFEILESAKETVELRPQETAMAASLIDSLAADFDPSRFNDDYRDAMVELIERKRTSGETRPTPDAAAAQAGDAADSMTDLLSALQRSVEAAQAAQGESKPSVPAQRSASAEARAEPEAAAAPEPEPEPKKKNPAKSSSGKTRTTGAKRTRRTA
jgi:DNA end-binding protein Ku